MINFSRVFIWSPRSCTTILFHWWGSEWGTLSLTNLCSFVTHHVIKFLPFVSLFKITHWFHIYLPFLSTCHLFSQSLTLFMPLTEWMAFEFKSQRISHNTPRHEIWNYYPLLHGWVYTIDIQVMDWTYNPTISTKVALYIVGTEHTSIAGLFQ